MLKINLLELAVWNKLVTNAFVHPDIVPTLIKHYSDRRLLAMIDCLEKTGQLARIDRSSHKSQR